MIKPAILYEAELQKKNYESWYNPDNMYWHSGCGEFKITLHDNTSERHQFVSVDKNNNVIGYISYAVDWDSESASQFGIISYDKGNLLFIKDIQKAINDIFFKYNFNRMEWWCYEDNPAIKGYRKFIKRFGGRECGYLRQISKLMDGKLHDSVFFEILKSEIIKEHQDE